VLERVRRARGADHPEVAEALKYLGHLRQAMGDHAGAERHYRESLELFRAALGKFHVSVADLLTQTAVARFLQGDHTGAELLHQQAVEVALKVVGRDHPASVQCLDALASMYQLLGRYRAAEPLLRANLETLQRAAGDRHPGLAPHLLRLADLYRALGEPSAARPLYEQAADLLRDAGGGERRLAPAPPLGLALLHLAAGERAAAEPLLRRAVEAGREVFAGDHPELALALQALAAVRAAGGREAEAMALLGEAEGVQDRLAFGMTALPSERQRALFLQNLLEDVPRLLSLVAQALGGSPPAAGRALGLVLRRKAAWVEALGAGREAAWEYRHPHLRDDLHQLTVLRKQIGMRLAAGPGAEGPEEHRRLLEDWRGRWEELEDRPDVLMPEWSVERACARFGREALAEELPPGTALVEFVRCHRLDFAAYFAASPAHPEHYFALAVPADRPGDVALTDLGPAGPIDALAGDFRRALAEGGAEADRLGAELAAKLLAPLRQSLGGAARLLLAPDGDLLHLPFAALPGAAGGRARLLDAYAVSHLACARDLPRAGALFPVTCAEPLVLAPGETGGPPRPPARGFWARLFRRGAAAPAAPAPGGEVAALLGGRVVRGAEAARAALERCHSPRLLHLEFPAFCRADRHARFDRPPGGNGIPDPELELNWENPLLRCGLDFGPPAGTLSARDVCGLDLTGTELVVLAGGIRLPDGDAPARLGMTGLLRSFFLAGARGVLVCDAAVPGEERRQVLADFYRRLFDGQVPAEALRQAQQAARRRAPGGTHWAGFRYFGHPVRPLGG
ncbi:MAG TPA: tetratricopeptide repeat protein, partial [Gemmataceae bacterium]